MQEEEKCEVWKDGRGKRDMKAGRGKKEGRKENKLYRGKGRKEGKKKKKKEMNEIR